jgi:hypothetical protein
LQERGETIPEPTTKVGLVGVTAWVSLPNTQKLIGAAPPQHSTTSSTTTSSTAVKS